MLTSTLLMALAAATQSGDPSQSARNAYTACLRRFMNTSIQSRMAEPAFNEALPQQCQDEERAFRAALVTRERGYRTPAAEVEQIATDEVNDARSNFRDQFAGAQTPS